MPELTAQVKILEFQECIAADGGVIAAAVPTLPPKPSREQEMKLVSRASCEMLLKSATTATKTTAYLLGAADGRAIAAAIQILQPKPSREQEMKLNSRASCEMLLKSATTATKAGAYVLGAADGGVIAAAIPVLQPKPSREQEI